MMNENMMNLAAILTAHGIPYEPVVQPLFGTWQICVPCADRSLKAGDFICNRLSSGHEFGLLECAGFGLETDECIGYLTAERAAEIVINWYNNLKRED